MLEKLICWWMGHDYLFPFNPKATQMLCLRCGHAEYWEKKR